MQLKKASTPILIFLFSCILSSCNKSHVPKFEQRPFISLEGIWQSELGEIELPGTVDESKLPARNIDTLQSIQLTRLYAYEGKMRYVRTVNIPASLADKEWRLIMERTKPSTIWIDGDSIGSSSLILSPQIYSIGKLTSGEHTISIEVDNSPSSVPDGIKGSHAWTNATQTNWNGIIGKFGLEAHDGIVIESLQVYASTSSPTIPIVAQINSSLDGKCSIKVRGYTWNTQKEINLPEQIIEIDLQSGSRSYNFNLEIGEEKILWSEFDPALYKVNFQLISGQQRDNLTLDFGIRDFSTQGSQFTINSLKTSLRGKHDACVFPLTGYPPMDKEEWLRQFRISKQYGINHYRFHSWTPPQAAFDAANEEGIYMQAELPYWGEINQNNVELNTFLINEGEHILDSYGNNPSFVMMALGNELGGDTNLMRSIVDDFRDVDQRHLYAFGANNALGTGGQQKGEDFFVTCRVGGQVGSDDYSKHTRSTFSFADAKSGGYMNGLYPSTNRTFSDAIVDCTVPVISHENGQFQMYPNYNEIEKYTGVLYPYNLELFRKRLSEKGMIDQANIFHKASVQFALGCYKEDIEMCLRTPEFGGFQILDLQDYPGQGSAYVGVLDAFMDVKDGVSAEKFGQFSNEVVPMAIMPKYTWYNSENLSAEIKIYNYSSSAINNTLEWSLNRIKEDSSIGNGKLLANIPQGTLVSIGNIEIPLSILNKATQLQLELKLGERTNKYDLWVYPVAQVLEKSLIEETTSLTKTVEMLKMGKTVLFTPNHKDIEKLSVGGMFTPDYWNYAMFKSISESLHRKVSPGTLSILADPTHPLFKNFPTDFCSNWQWWIISKNSRPFILDETSNNYRPIVQVIDNIERNHKLGLIYEMKVGKGKLLVSMCNLKNILDTPEGKQFYNAILSYMDSPDFKPQTEFTYNELENLFHNSIREDNIKGVKNITTYK